jgi:hypothetical protein
LDFVEQAHVLDGDRSRLIFRRTSSTSEKPPDSLKATSPRVANRGRPVANEPDEATIAAAIVAARTNLLVAKRIDDPVRWDQFDTNYSQHRWVWMRDLNQCLRKSVTMFIPSQLADQGAGKRRAGMTEAYAINKKLRG